MTTKTKPKAKPNKQHDVRAASFLRLAKDIEAGAKEHSGSECAVLMILVKALKKEVKMLRGMR